MSNKKIIAVPDDIISSCEGCCFNKHNVRHNMSCNEDSQNIDGEEINCLDNNIIYKEEKDMNVMPTLEAGMIVKLKNKDLGLLLPAGTGLILVDNHGQEIEFKNRNMDAIYLKSCINNYHLFFKGFALDEAYDIIWSKKSDKDIQIEEIEKDIENLKAKVRELKE